MLRLVARTWMNLFPLCNRDGGRRRLRGGGGGGGGVHYDPTSGIARPTADGKRRLIRGDGFASRVSGTVRPQVAAPRRRLMIFLTQPNYLGGGGPVVPSRISVVLVEETKAGDTSRPECPCDDHERQPLAQMKGRGGSVSEGDTRSPCGALPSSGTAGRLLPAKVTKAPTLSVGGPRSVPSRILVVLGTLQDGSVRVRMGFGDRGLARRGRPVCLWVAAMQDGRVLGRRCPPLMLPEGSCRWWPLGGLPWWVLRTMWAPMARLLQVAPLARGTIRAFGARSNPGAQF